MYVSALRLGSYTFYIMTHALPITKDALVKTLIYQQIIHILTLEEVNRKGFLTPDACDMTDHIMSIMDVVKRSKRRNLEKLIYSKVEGLDVPTEAQIWCVVEEIYCTL